ncbi:hypothetical protein [Methylophilus sp. 5]|uniref:hypothetical protein n=1 Tax=Methylophilus sp. 5 TaxID=1112274 RepID=UPI0012F80A97|nr:hypothetical protein [Methylophilus sp. 5]
MRLVNLSITLGLTCVLSGCLCMGCFVPQLPPPPKTQIDDWERSETSSEVRLADWQVCGGQKNGDVPRNPKNAVEGENIQQAFKRQNAEHQRCLIRKGYHYIGLCSTEYWKTMPACGTP